MEQRPNPDLLLEQINKESRKATKGKLKIFFGYAAGVGKTYAMLDAAKEDLKAGKDVVVGYVEPHDRPETLALLEGLEVMMPLVVQYKGIKLNEFDLDAALKRRPELILVDELAHTNAKGCRHMKRYKDIEELLEAGIDVYTTVNVQHIESLNDIVASITEIIVRERIPDILFDEADQIELVDIEPIDLLKRLAEGKVYHKNQVIKATSNFFTKENLTALREIALRRTADRVNHDITMSKEITGKMKMVGEHILVCLSPAPSNAKVIRTAARMANAFNAPLTAFLVETPTVKDLQERTDGTLKENIRLAKEFGARIVTTCGEDIALHIAEYAKASGISKIVVGRTNTKRLLFSKKASFVERLIKLAPSIDVYIIPDVQPNYKKKYIMRKTKIESMQLMITLSISLVTAFIGLVFENIGLRESNIIMIFILGVLLSSTLTTKKVYGVIASFIAVVTFNFCFTEPRYSLHAYDTEYPITFLIMLVVAFVTSSLTIKVKSQAKQAAIKAYRTELLLETSRSIHSAQNEEAIMEKAAIQMIKLLDKSIILYRREKDRLGKPRCFKNEDFNIEETYYTTNDERAVAEWVYKNKVPAGISTNTLPGAKALYLPIDNDEEVFAVVGIIMKQDEELEPFEYNILIAILSEIAITLDKHQLNAQSKQKEIEAEQEKLRVNLLRTISHDLRTPLTSISENASVLLENDKNLSEAVRQEACQSIYKDAVWLIDLVENLLSITRVENDTVKLSLQAKLAEDIATEDSSC